MRTAHGTFKCPVQKVYSLEVYEESEHPILEENRENDIEEPAAGNDSSMGVSKSNSLANT